MSREENAAREDICRLGRSLFARGLTFGSSGNISVRVGERLVTTPTGVRMGDLDPAALSVLDAQGRHVDGPKPTKETFLHRAMYGARADAAAVVHLHSTHSVAVSVLDGLDPDEPIPPLTAYFAMRVGRLALLPYFAPGDEALGPAVAARAERHHALLLANHGPVAAGTSLLAAADAIEELEETAKLYLMLRHEKVRPLDAAQIADLEKRYGGK